MNKWGRAVEAAQTTSESANVEYMYGWDKELRLPYRAGTGKSKARDIGEIIPPTSEMRNTDPVEARFADGTTAFIHQVSKEDFLGIAKTETKISHVPTRKKAAPVETIWSGKVTLFQALVFLLLMLLMFP